MNQEFDVLNSAPTSAVKSWRLDDFEGHSPSSVINDVYASDVLTLEQLRQRLSRPVFKSLQGTLERSTTLDPAIADTVALAMKTWAMEKGATHYTHWFQPLEVGRAVGKRAGRDPPLVR